jgi:hypothetical protein
MSIDLPQSCAMKARLPLEGGASRARLGPGKATFFHQAQLAADVSRGKSSIPQSAFRNSPKGSTLGFSVFTVRG